MKGLLLHCKKFSFKDIKNSTKPIGISSVIKGQKHNKGLYKMKVVVFACFEKLDTDEEVKVASKHINHMSTVWHGGNKNILVMPFAHLSNSLAEPVKARRLLNNFLKLLRNLGNKVELITFGTHKEWMVDVYGYPRATSWFQFPE